MNDQDNSTDYSLDSTGSQANPWSVSVNGCGYLLFVTLVTVVMLVVNAIVCLSIHSALMNFGPAFLQDPASFGPQVSQLFFFIVPVGLTILQWNLIDRLGRMAGKK